MASRRAASADDGEPRQPWLPVIFAVAVLPELATAWPPAEKHPSRTMTASGTREIPGRKRGADRGVCHDRRYIGPSRDRLVRRQGASGRLLAGRWKVPVTTLDSDPALLRGWRDMAARAGVEQDFAVADVTPHAGAFLDRSRHAVALHACGHLHRVLVARAAPSGLAALDVVPCCYHHGMKETTGRCRARC